MNQLDLLVLLFIFLGGWLGSLRNIAKNFISFASTMIGLAMASLYGGLFSGLWATFFGMATISERWLPVWATTVSANTGNWQQSAVGWLNDLAWPANYKQWVIDSWQQLGPNGSFNEWAKIVEQAFWRSLSNVCSFLTIILLVKLAVTILAKFSLRIASSDQQARTTLGGFCIGALQGALLVLLVVAFAIPFLIISDRMMPMLQPSFTFTLVKRVMEYFIVG